MKYLFLGYPNCQTSKKAEKWLEEHNIEYSFRHIVDENPTKEELKQWIDISNLPIKRFFNTSGIKYRQLNLKDKLKEMSEENMIKLLSSDGMLVKRPIIIGNDIILTGFKIKEWEENIK